MTFRNLKTLTISATFLFLCAACSSSEKHGVELTTPWLGPVQGFERVSGQDNVGVFLRSTTGETVRFERAVILPPEIIVSTRSDLESMSPATFAQIKRLFSDIFQQEMAKQFPTAKDDNAASHLIPAALTNVTVTRKTDAARTALITDLQFSFEDAAIEAEFRVRKTNARQAVFVLPATAGKTDWNNLPALFTKIARAAAAEAGKTRDAINARADRPPPAAKAPAKK